MILATGIDIVEVPRMRRAAARWDKHFLQKVFTPREIAYARTRRFAHQHLAARFAAKEAVVKAFGEARTFPVKWTDIEVVNDSEGKPTIAFHGDALQFKKKKDIRDVIVSMSHAKEYAVASVILIKGRR